MLSNFTIDELIEMENEGIIFACENNDKEILNKIFKEINELSETDYHYVSELYYYIIPTAGKVISKYIFDIASQEIRARISPQMLYPRIKNCAEINLELYKHFKESEYYKYECIFFYAFTYDWNLSKLRPKRLKNELYELIINPKDAYYFPYTVRMLSSWNYPNMEEKLKEYIRNDYTRADFGFNENSIKIENIDWLKLMKKSLLKTGLENLRYYPSEENIDILKKYVDYKDQEIQKTAKKSLDKMQVQIR